MKTRVKESYFRLKVNELSYQREIPNNNTSYRKGEIQRKIVSLPIFSFEDKRNS